MHASVGATTGTGGRRPAVRRALVVARSFEDKPIGVRANYSNTDAVISFFSSLLDMSLALQEITAASCAQDASLSDRPRFVLDASALRGAPRRRASDLNPRRPPWQDVKPGGETVSERYEAA